MPAKAGIHFLRQKMDTGFRCPSYTVSQLARPHTIDECHKEKPDPVCVLLHFAAFFRAVSMT